LYDFVIPYNKRGDTHLDYATHCDKLSEDGNYLKDIITDAQAKFLNAVRIVSKKSDSDLTEEQAIKVQCEINQATIDIVIYNDLLRRLYEAINISRQDT